MLNFSFNQEMKCWGLHIVLPLFDILDTNITSNVMHYTAQSVKTISERTDQLRMNVVSQPPVQHGSWQRH